MGLVMGLSYSTFKYEKLTMPTQVKSGNAISFSVAVSNNSKTDGEEVVQIYVTNPNTQVKSPLKALKGFERISLKAGERKVVNFTLSPEQLSFVNEDGVARLMKGKLVISAGGSQPDEANPTSGNILSQTISVL